MTDRRNARVVPFPATLLTAALALTGVMLVAMAWSGVTSYRNIATAQARDLRIEELRGAIVHLDEVLTMSARMAATTGNSDWERRYRQFEPQLDAAIREAMALTARLDGAHAASETDTANLKLVDMENHGFNLVRAGEAGRAKAILFGDAYAAQKRIYAEGMAKLVQNLKDELTADQREKQREALLSVFAVAFCIVLLFSTWLSVLRRLHDWRTMQSVSLDALIRAEEALRKLNDGLEKRVEDRTRSLQLEIRERKDAEAALRESEARNNAIVQSAPDCIVMINHHGNILEFNPAAERTFGHTRAEVLGRELAEVIIPSSLRDRHRQGMIRLLATGESRMLGKRIEMTAVRSDGSEFPVELATTRLVAEGTPTFTSFIRDMSERKRTEAALERAHADVLEASRQAGMAEVATGVLHDVGNVLNSVTVASSCLANSVRRSKAANLSRVVALLREHEEDLSDFFTKDPNGRHVPVYLAQLAGHLASEQTDVLKELEQLQRNIEHIKNIVTMQQDSAKTSGVTELVAVTDLVEEALRMDLSGLARRDIEVVKDLRDSSRIAVEKHKVLQILINLVRNAEQACEALSPHERQLTIRTTSGEGRVRIVVGDNGVGILPENLNRIFSHGFTTKTDGHGFGLHSALIAARGMGGSLTVRSDGPGQGAAFTLELPCAPREHSHP